MVFGWLVGFLTSSSTTRLYRGRVPRLTSDNFTCCHTGEWGDHDFCLTRSHYTDTHPTSRERTTTVGIEPTQDLLTRSRALYRLNYRAPRLHVYGKVICGTSYHRALNFNSFIKRTINSKALVIVYLNET